MEKTWRRKDERSNERGIEGHSLQKEEIKRLLGEFRGLTMLRGVRCDT